MGYGRRGGRATAGQRGRRDEDGVRLTGGGGRASQQDAVANRAAPSLLAFPRAVRGSPPIKQAPNQGWSPPPPSDSFVHSPGAAGKKKKKSAAAMRVAAAAADDRVCPAVARHSRRCTAPPRQTWWQRHRSRGKAKRGHGRAGKGDQPLVGNDAWGRTRARRRAAGGGLPSTRRQAACEGWRRRQGPRCPQDGLWSLVDKERTKIAPDAHGMVLHTHLQATLLVTLHFVKLECIVD